MDIELIMAIIAGAVGVGIGYAARVIIAKQKVASAENKATTLIADAKNRQKEMLLEAKDKAIGLIDEAKKEESARRRELSHQQKRLEERESRYDQQILRLDSRQRELLAKAKKLRQAKDQIVQIRTEQIAKLESIAQLTQDDAKNILLAKVEKKVGDDLMQRIKKLELQASEDVEQQAREMLTDVMERCVHSHVTETTSTTVELPSDEMKGRIIGKEGRNIKTLEKLTGVDILIDETPQVITVSGFSPIRRQLAKRALEKLIMDGRIHPARIEDAVDQAKKELALDLKKAGDEALYEMGIAGVDPKFVQIIGRLKYRTSYGQNVLAHSIEVARIGAYLAQQLGADVNVCKKAGLFHDIGKAIDREIEGTHPQLGRDIAQKFGLSQEIITPILTHHEDRPPTLEAVIIKVADAISGARPGARKDTLENYIQRLTELENIANSFNGVEKSYAIQAGRELRVFVEPEQVDDYQAHKLASEIAERVQAELKYPGEIKINVIRESRVIEYAR